MCGQVEILPTVNHNSLSPPCTSCMLPSTTVLTHRTPRVACILTSLLKIVNTTTALTGTVTAVTPDSFQVALGATTLKTLSPRITDYVGTLEQSAL